MDHAAPTAIRDDAPQEGTIDVALADGNLIVREEMWALIERDRDLPAVKPAAELDEMLAGATPIGG